MLVKQALLINIKHKGWIIPKSFIFETDVEEGEHITHLANRVFEKYKASQKIKDLKMVNYEYLGDTKVVKNK